MSYSRWGRSAWYTYYAVSHTYERDKQFFVICAVAGFLYKDLKERPFYCLKKAWRECPDATKEEMRELIGYMQEFISDVEANIDINAYMKIKEASDEELPTLIGISKEPEIMTFLEQKIKNMKYKEKVP